jgi:hypothetical protein
MKGSWRFLVFLPVPVITALAMWWDRMAHDVTSSPQPWERVLAKVVWYGSLLALAAVPVIWDLRRRTEVRTHSVTIALLLAGTAGLYLIGVIDWGWPMWPEIFNADLELVGGTYLVSAGAFSLALYEAIRSFRAGTRRRAIGSSSVAAVSGAVALVSSYMLVFFE